MRMVPVAAVGVLIQAAPNRIDQLAGERQRLPCHALRVGVAFAGTPHAVLDAVPVQILLGKAPAAQVPVVTLQNQGRELFSQLRRQRRSRESHGRLRTDRRPGRGVRDDALEQRAHPRRRYVPGELDELLSGAVEDHRRRPPVVLVPVGEVGTRILIDPECDEVFADLLDDLGVLVGRLLHHVAPMAPDRDQVENHQALFGARPIEGCVGPSLPGNLRGRRFGPGEGPRREEQADQELG